MADAFTKASDHAAGSIYEYAAHLSELIANESGEGLSVSGGVIAVSIPLAWISLIRLEGFLKNDDSLPAKVIRGSAFIANKVVQLFAYGGTGLLVLGLAIGEIATVANPEYHDWIKGVMANAAEGFAYSIVAGVSLGLTSWLLISRVVEPWANKIIRDTVKDRSDKDSHTDIRDVDDMLPKRVEFDPREQFDIDAGVFLGATKVIKRFLRKDIIEKAIVTWERWQKMMVVILGPGGTGKTLQAASVLYQSILKGHGAYVFDPKNDEFLPHVLKEACEKAGKPFVLINLREGQPRQINPLKGCRPDDIALLLNAGFGFEEKGLDSDHYRRKDRNAIKKLAKYFKATGVTPTFLRIKRAMIDVLGESGAAAVEGTADSLEEMSELESINAIDGVDIDSAMKNGGCVYVIGSDTDATVIKAQKLLAIRAMVAVRNRDKSQERRHVTFLLEEFKFMTSMAIIRLLGTARDSACNIMVVTQGLADLYDNGGLNPKMVIKIIDTNCRVKWCYQTDDSDTIDWITKKTGDIPVETEMSEVERNESNAEIRGADTRIGESRRYLIDRNMLLMLPEGCGVMIEPGKLARMVFSSPIRVQKGPVEVTEAVEPEGNSPEPSGLDDLI